MAKPKLALIPAAQGSRFYSVLPSDGVGDFNFARASAATRINKYGLIETVASGQSRLNYPLIDGVVKGCPHHLLEPARTNLVIYSEDTTTWGKNLTPVVTLNEGIAPNGTQTSDKAVVNSISEGFYNFNAGTVTSGTTYTVSIFIKHISGIETIRFGFAGTAFGGDNDNVFNIVNGTIVTSVANSTNQIINYGNGWFRLICTKAATVTNTGGFILYGNENAEIQYNLWGAQFEASSYVTSYIVSNSGSATTRVAETANGAVDASMFNDSEGVLMAEIISENDGTYKGISISDGTFNNTIIIGKSSVNNRIYGRINVGGVSQGDININDINTKNFYKVALKYSLNNVKIFVNGFLLGTDTTSNVFSANTLNKIAFNGGTNGLINFYGNIKQIQYFNTALTDAELQALTTL